jgi:predicted Holliday junction resolvase-like endonuclease
MFNFIEENLLSVIELIVIVILFTVIVVSNLRLRKINKNYRTFLKKLGNGENLEEMLKKYIQKVESIEAENAEIKEYCKKLNEDMTSCIQKIGIVRYNAFKDTGSELSFALALLDENNSGVVLNGIYSREMSNIYAKQIVGGKTSNKLSEEEEKALDRAIKKS